MKQTILIVDDEKNIRESLKMIIEDEGFQVLTAGSGEEALEIFEKQIVHLIILDVWLPKMDGIAVLNKVKKLNPSVEVIVISGHADLSTAVKAVKEGAYDFLEKPLSKEKIVISIKRILEKQKLETEYKELKNKLDWQFELIGESGVIKKLKETIAKIAPTKSRVLVRGESGTGKELVVRAIHFLSPRKNGPFVKINCAAIPSELIESELFGHEAGAFTGAKERKIGKFEQAHTGTIFLDEIGDMPLSMQAKLLRVLQEDEFERIGSNKKINIDVRVIAATNKNLEEETKNGKFREDLYFRISAVPILVPPLREHSEDIPILINYFLQKFSQENNMKKKNIEKEGIESLKNYSWQGNVRELKNFIERLVILTKGEVITDNEIMNLLPKSIAVKTGSLQQTLEEMEKKLIANALELNDWNITKTAKSLGMDRTNLHKKLNSYQIKQK